MHENPLLIHLHIPKTAGVTLRQIVDRQYPPNAILTLQTPETEHWPELHALRIDQEQTVSLIRGHFSYGIHTLLQRPVRYFTLLRDPVERIISLYYYGLEGRSKWIHERIRQDNMTLADFAAGDFPQTNNHQTRLISGDPEGGPESLSRAMENLECHFDVVGVSERFDETLLLLRKLLGWKNVHYYRRNVTRNRPDRSAVDNSVIRNIEQRNELDLQLYAFARSLLEGALVREGITDQMLRQFRRTNRFYEGVGALLDLGSRLLPGRVKDGLKTVVPFRR